ncbi:MAG TPA: ABC transporter permease [Nocardioides sp.]|nr:ABC transporter permease [Nocardioides sp.]
MSITTLPRRAGTSKKENAVEETSDDRFAAADREASAKARRLRLRRRSLVWLGRVTFVVLVLGGWELLSGITLKGADAPIIDPFYYSRPTEIVHRTIELFRDGTSYGSYWFDIFTTMKEAVYGFGIGTALGVVVGVLLGQSGYLADVLGPYIKMVNAIPRIVLGSIFTVALGVGVAPKVALAGVLVFFIVFFNAFQGVREVDQNILANAKVLGASRLQIVRHVTLPSAFTWIAASLHSAFGFAIVGAIVGEVLGAQHGLGLIIKTSQNRFDPAGVWACMFVIMVLVLGAEFLIGRLEKRLLRWRPPSRTESAGL